MVDIKSGLHVLLYNISDKVEILVAGSNVDGEQGQVKRIQIDENLEVFYGIELVNKKICKLKIVYVPEYLLKAII